MRVRKWLLACFMLLAADSTIVFTFVSALIPASRAGQILQIGTARNGALYVVRYDQVTKRLVFDVPSKSNCYFLKQTWLGRTRGAATSGVYLSLQLRLTDGTSLPSGFDYYLTRDTNSSLKLYPSNARFLSAATDLRIFDSSFCCVSAVDFEATIIYWGSGPYTVLAASEHGILTAVGGVGTLSCGSASQVFYIYPSAIVVINDSLRPSAPNGTSGDDDRATSCPFGPIRIAAGGFDSESLSTGSGDSAQSTTSRVRVARGAIRPQRREDAAGPPQTNRASSVFGSAVGIVSPTVDLASSLAFEKASDDVQLVVDYGSERRKIVLVAGSSARMARFSTFHLDKSTVFRYQLYKTFTITAEGNLAKVSSFTLLHRDTNSYLVANVSNAGELQVHSGMSGLRFAPRSDFTHRVDNHPDYRFFVQYHVRLHDGRSVRTFCSIFFRTYCLWPASTIKLSLRPVETDYNLTTSTFTNPDNDALLSFYDRARRAARSLSVPVLSFNNLDLFQ